MKNIEDNKDCFAFWVSRTYDIFKNKLENELKQYNLTILQRDILLALYKYGAMSQRQICEHTMSESSNITATLKRMQTKGLIKKAKHPTDKRAIMIKPTPKANSLKDELRDMGNNIKAKLLTCIENDEEKKAVLIFKKIYKKYLQDEYEKQINI